MIAQTRKFWSLNITAEEEKNQINLETISIFCLFAWSSFFKKSYLTQEKVKIWMWTKAAWGSRGVRKTPPARLGPSSEGAISIDLSVSISHNSQTIPLPN